MSDEGYEKVDKRGEEPTPVDAVGQEVLLPSTSEPATEQRVCPWLSTGAVVGEVVSKSLAILTGNQGLYAPSSLVACLRGVCAMWEPPVYEDGCEVKEGYCGARRMRGTI